MCLIPCCSFKAACVSTIVLASTLLALLFLLPASTAYYVSISDTVDAYPLLAASDTGKPLLWATGTLARLQLASVAVRVSDRGVRFFSRPATLLRLGSNISNTINSTGWHSAPCRVAQGLLCTTQRGSVLFPVSPSSVVVPDNYLSVQDAFMGDVARRECNRHANRFVVSGSSVSSYTASLCDVTQKGFEFVLDTDTQEAHVRRRHDPAWLYIVICVFAIVLMTCLAQDVSHLLGNRDERPNPLLATACCLFLFGFSWGMPAHYIVRSDMMYQWLIVSYILFSLVVWIVRLRVTELDSSGWWFRFKESGSSSEHSVPFNVVIATLFFALCRLYAGIECQYILPLLFLMALRSFHKASALFHFVVRNSWWMSGSRAQRDKSFMKRCALEEASTLFELEHVWGGMFLRLYSATIGLDFGVIAVTHQYGFRPLFVNGFAGDVYFAITMLTAMTMVLVLWERGPTKPVQSGSAVQ